MVSNESSRRLIANYYECHLDELVSFVAKRLNDADGARDIVQNIFLRLLTGDKMISEVTLPCLVYTVARNLIIDRMRHFCRVGEYEHYIQRSSSDTYNAESVYAVHEIEELMERGAAHLSESSQNIYRMNVLYGMKTAEISRELNIDYKTVENSLGKARKEVRRYLKKVL